MADSFHIVVQRFHIPVPVFADSVEVIAFLASYGIEELGDKLIFHMFDSVQAHAVEVQFGGDPFSPSVQFGDHFRMVEVEVVAQQEIVITILAVYSVAPCFPFTLNLEDAATLLCIVEACTGEMIPMPFEIGIFIFTTMKTVTGPPLYLERFAQYFVSLVWVDFHNHELFGEVTACFMVQYHIEVD